MRLNIGVKALQYITVRFKCVIKAHGFIFIISVTGRGRDLFQFVKKTIVKINSAHSLVK